MKGIILAGGSGSRLFPLTKSVNKHLLPVYNKPLVYYPLATLMEVGIRDILLITSKNDLPLFKKLLGDGIHLGIFITYEIQEKPQGISQAFIIGENFINRDQCCLILSDNIFYGENMVPYCKKAVQNAKCGQATIFCQHVNNPQRYGVLQFDDKGIPQTIIEKPTSFISSYAVTGLYFYDERVVDYAKVLKPSQRNEYEITDLNNLYLADNSMEVQVMKDVWWIDAGTFDDLLSAGNYIFKRETETCKAIGDVESIALRNQWIENI